MILSIIIVSYNTELITLQTFKSVISELRKNSQLLEQTEIIIIDNHSTDNSIPTIKKFSKSLPEIQSQQLHLTVIENSQNAGFAVANNQGIKTSTGKYILLLNSDTIVQSNALTQLLANFGEYPIDETTAELSSMQGKIDRLGIVAATLLNPDGSLQPQGGSFPNLLTLFNHMFFLDDLPLIGKWLPSTQHTGKNFEHLIPDTDATQLQQQDWVGGTAMMVKRQVVEEIGPLDQNIFMYGEDIEFCLRAKNHHWDIGIDPQALVVHLGSASSSSKNAILGEIKGYIYLWAKHKPHWQGWLVKCMMWWGTVLRVFLFGTIMHDKTRRDIYRQAVAIIDES